MMSGILACSTSMSICGDISPWYWYERCGTCIVRVRGYQPVVVALLVSGMDMYGSDGIWHGLSWY